MISRALYCAAKRRVAVCILSLPVCLALPVSAGDLLMPGLSAQWIARDMSINGVPTSMRSVEGAISLDRVLRHYRRAWGDGLEERTEGMWHVLATRERDRFISLRLRRAGNAVQGILVVSADPSKATPSLRSDLPVPPGLERLSHQSFRDGGTRGENLTLASHRTVAFERQAFDFLYRSEDWLRVEDRRAQSVADGHVLQFVRGKRSARIILYRDPALLDGRTLILVTAFSQ